MSDSPAPSGLSAARWIPLDNAVSYTLEKKGDGLMTDNDSLNVDFAGIMYDSTGKIEKIDSVGDEFGVMPTSVLHDFVKPMIPALEAEYCTPAEMLPRIPAPDERFTIAPPRCAIMTLAAARAQLK